LESEEGCSVAIDVTINQVVCDASTLRAEWAINGTYIEAPDNLPVTISLNEGDNVRLSMVPNGIPFTISKDGNQVYSGQGDYVLGLADNTDNGSYILTAQNGCSTAITLNVIATVCDAFTMKAEWTLDGGTTYNEALDEQAVTVPSSTGDTVFLSMVPNEVNFTITYNGAEIYNGRGDYSLGEVTTANSGSYTINAVNGCSTTINLTVAEELDPCLPERSIPEYRINGDWQSGSNELSLELGTSLMLSMLPNDLSVSITLPNGDIVGDNYNLGNIDSSDSGVYIVTSGEGCSTTIDLTVTGELDPCLPERSIPEYRINGDWQSGSNELNLELGTSLMLSMLPNDLSVSITLPNGDIVGDNYNLGNIDSSDSGVYTITSGEGCSTTITLNAAGLVCDATTMRAEWSLDGGSAYSTAPDNLPLAVNASIGDNVFLGMQPNGIAFSVSYNGIEVYTGTGDYELGNVTTANSGDYIINAVNGCSTTITLNVTDTGSNCSETSIIPEYRVDGVWESGLNDLQLTKGTALMLSMLPNGVGVSIELPNGEIVGDNYNLGGIDVLDEGLYVLTSSEGCSTTINLVVTDTSSNCSETSIIPEYRVDGAWESGLNNLQLTKGTALMLSMLPNGVGVSIELPNGEIVGDNYNLGSIEASDGGLYVLTSSEGCSTTITLNVLEELTLKLNSTTFQNGLSIDSRLDDQTVNSKNVSIYPNPTKGELNLDLRNKPNEALDVRVVNASGQVVYFIMYNTNHEAIENIDLSGLTEGIYHIVVEGVDFKVSKSVIVKK
uniref:T9SS type A sorting domain-containing protein n=1 Tax=Maribacter sp. TaxID=1897614 RepID=UPI0025BAFC2D